MKRSSRALRPIAALAFSGALLLSCSSWASADQVRDGQWANQAFDLEKVWSVSKGDGVTVAVIDGGVDITHPDLVGQVLPGYDPDGAGRDRDPGADIHGTQMAGIIAGHGHGEGGAEGVVGLAPGVKILPLYKDRGGADAVPEDIRWAVDHQAKVINISLGEAGTAGPALATAVAYAAQHDALIVASSGNSGQPVGTPANEPGVLAVGAVDRDLAVWGQSNFGPEVALAAPGVGIVTAAGGHKYEIGDGTSAAAAYVSATAALVRSKFPNLTAGQVINRLVKSALVPDQLKGVNLPDPHYGYGIVRPYQALTQDIEPGSSQGPLPQPKAGAGVASAELPSIAGGSVSSGIPVHLAAVGLVLVVAVGLIAGVLAVRARRRRQVQTGYPYQPWSNGGPSDR